MVLDFASDAVVVFDIQEVDNILHKLLLCLEGFAVVVADNVRHLGLLHGAVDAGEEVETFVVLRVFGTLRGRQQPIEFHRDKLRIDHLVLGIAGMDVLTLDADVGTGGVKVFEF